MDATAFRSKTIVIALSACAMGSFDAACDSASARNEQADASAFDADDAGHADELDASDAAQADVEADDARDDDAADAGLGSCCEIFPKFAADDGGADADTSHANPLSASFGAVAIGSSLDLQLRYYDVCGEPDLRVVRAYLLPEGGSKSGPFEIVYAPKSGFHILGAEQALLGIRFAPVASGLARTTAILETNHGYYQTDLDGVGR